MEHQRHTESAPSNHAELERLAAERLKTLEHGAEHAAKRHEKVEAAREHLARAEQVRPAAEHSPTAEPMRRQPVLTKAASYRETMVSLRHRMKPAARAFSAFIHHPTIEATSEVVGQTLVRPSASLGATTCAVLITGFLYLNARHYGYVLRGSEIWITLLIGACVGLIAEALITLLRRLRRA